MVKKNTKKTQKKTNRTKKVKSSSNEIKINKNVAIASIIGVIAVILAIALYSLTATSGEVLVVVNGEEITRTQLQERITFLDSLGYEIQNDMQVLDELVTERLLLQEVERQNIQVNDAEVDEELNLFITFNQITIEEFESQLQESGVSIEDFKSFFKTNILISKFIEESFIAPEISEDEARAFYNENIEVFNMDGTYMEFSTVEEDIKEYLQELYVSTILNELLSDLQEDANIVYNR